MTSEKQYDPAVVDQMREDIARLGTRTNPFKHTWQEQNSPCVPGWYCCVCGKFVKKMDDKTRALNCGRVTYPL